MKQHNYQKIIECPRCDGNGEFIPPDMTNFIRCPMCDGKKKIWIDDKEFYNIYELKPMKQHDIETCKQEDCPYCEEEVCKSFKQHISIEQLHELSGDGKERLREWWEMKNGDLTNEGVFLEIDRLSNDWWFYDSIVDGGRIKRFCDFSMKDQVLPFLSIGQMIEFLGDDWHQRWTLHGDIFCIENKDLRDRLWGACKRKLEK